MGLMPVKTQVSHLSLLLILSGIGYCVTWVKVHRPTLKTPSTLNGTTFTLQTAPTLTRSRPSIPLILYLPPTSLLKATRLSLWTGRQWAAASLTLGNFRLYHPVCWFIRLFLCRRPLAHHAFCHETLCISKGGIQLIQTYCDYLCLFGAYFLMVNAR